MHIAGKISLLLLVQNAPPPPPNRDSIPGTLVRFETVPVPAGPVTVPTSRGPRSVAVGPFAIGRTEVTWDEYDVWAFRLDLTPQERSSGVDRGGSWVDRPEHVGPNARARQTPAWNETDPQFPKSRWWLADAPFVGFRIVREP